MCPPVIHLVTQYGPSHIHFLVQSCKENVNSKRGRCGRSMGRVWVLTRWDVLMSSPLVRCDHFAVASSWRRSFPLFKFLLGVVIVLIMQIIMGRKLQAFCKLYKIYNCNITLYISINILINAGFMWQQDSDCVWVCVRLSGTQIWSYSILVCVKGASLMALSENVCECVCVLGLRVCVQMLVRAHRPMWTSDLWAVFNQAVENVIRQPSRAPSACKWAGPRCTLG